MFLTTEKKPRKNALTPSPIRRTAHNIRHENNNDEQTNPVLPAHSDDGVATNQTLSKRAPLLRHRRGAHRAFNFPTEAGERRQTMSGDDAPARHPRHRRQSLSALAFFDLHDIHSAQQHENRCGHHRLDQCEWPQCNFSCPQVRNPFTGEQMDFVDLLMQFGLDLSGIADALGMDLPTLQNMDHGELLRLLMQNSR